MNYYILYGALDMEKLILRLLALGEYSLTIHAQARMRQRNITPEDIRCCGKNGAVLTKEDRNYKVSGYDTDGAELKIVCAYTDEVLIITLF
jgi:hypothetical protein